MDLHTEPFVPKIRLHAGHPNEIRPPKWLCLFHTSKQPLQSFPYRWADHLPYQCPWEGTWESRQMTGQRDPTGQMRMGRALSIAASHEEAMGESRRARG